MKKFFVNNTRIVDEENRERIFHGVNMVFKGEYDEKIGRNNYIANWTEEDFDWLRDNGFNLVRLGIIWDGVEHEKNKINYEYLDWLEKIVMLCNERHIYVYLDMHQDLFGAKFGDGAPSWATFDDGLPHYSEGTWSDAYLMSDAVKTSFDSFWANKENIQDHFADLWKKIVERLKKHNNILGYDILNEPFPGSKGFEIFCSLLGSYATVVEKNLSIEKQIEMFSDEVQKIKMLMEIDDYEMYKKMTSSCKALLEEFDGETLNNFYQKVRDKIREETKDGIIFMENNYFSNMGIPSCVKRINEDQQIYAPHGYDLVVDSAAVSLSSNERISVIFDAHREAQLRMNVPVVIGEWGAHYDFDVALSHITHILNIFDKYKWSNTYWDYRNNMKSKPVVKRLIRPYPIAVAGEIISYSFNFDTKVFELIWNSNKELETIIFVPNKINEIKLREDTTYSIENISNSSKGNFVRIKTNKNGEYALTIIL